MMLLEADRTLPRPDAVSGIEVSDEIPSSVETSLEELLKDPDVLAVVEATDGLIPVG
jgi:hypothetical protein